MRRHNNELIILRPINFKWLSVSSSAGINTQARDIQNMKRKKHILFGLELSQVIDDNDQRHCVHLGIKVSK